MNPTIEPDGTGDQLVSYYWSGDTIRSRSVSKAVLTADLAVPAPPQWLLEEWRREVSSHLQLEAGDVEPLALARARSRWTGYRTCVRAVSDWASALGMQDVISTCDVALMACRGAKYHHEAAQYGAMAFCNLFLSEDKGQDLHFPATGHRIPLARGTVVLFDTAQPHAVIGRGSTGFQAANFAGHTDCTQVFLSWEIPVEIGSVGKLLGVSLDVAPWAGVPFDEEQVRLNGRPATVCPASGRWRQMA